MADPLSITLATITLATALKDIIELALMIEESFVKVSQNSRALFNLATEISATVKELKHFCDEHCDILSDAKEMKVALLELIINMRTVYTRCCEMIPSAPENKLRRVKFALNRWKNRNRVEHEIRELRNHVNKCHSRFTMFAVMRIEKRLALMSNRDVGNATGMRNKRTVTGDNLIAFMGSNHRTLSRLPPEITADLISDTYLRLQIDAINDYLIDLSSNYSYLTEAPSPLYLLPYEPAVNTGLQTDRNIFKQEVIAQTLEIQACLRKDPSILSIRAGACDMIDLSFGLYSLNMYKEAGAMGSWALKLCRTLAQSAPIDLLPHLIRGLQRLSYLYISIEDDDMAKVTIEEILSICHHLHTSSANPELIFQHGKALTTLAYVLGLKGDCTKSLETAQEGVRIYEGMVTKTYIPNLNTSTDDYGASLNQGYWAQSLAGFSRESICDYSNALQQLSFSLQGNKWLQDAVQADMKALDILLYLRQISASDTVQVDIVALLYRLSHQQFHSVMELEQSLEYSDQAVRVYRTLCEKDNQEHVVRLCHALYEKANTLGGLKRYDEALALWKETSELAKNIVDNQSFCADVLNGLSTIYHKLKRHEEAVVVRKQSVMIYQTVLNSRPDKAARSYYNLGVGLHLSGRFFEAIEALQTAIRLYRSLAFNNPDKHTKNIAETLTQLALNHIYSNRHDEAFNDGHESLKLHAELIDKDTKVMSEYIIALRINFLLAETAENESKCLERANHSLVCARQLVKRFPEECRRLLIEAILSQTTVFYRFDRLSEASAAIQIALDWFEQINFRDSKDITEQYMHCLIAYSVIFHSQGYTHNGLDLLGKSIEIGKPHILDPCIAECLITSMIYRAQALSSMGHYVEAARASTECETIARHWQNSSITSGSHIVGFIESLRVCCMMLSDIGDYTKAIAYTEEALKLCHTDHLEKAAQTKPFARLLEIDCLRNLSETLAHLDREPEAIDRAQQSISVALGLKYKYPTLPWSVIEPSYIEALRTLSERLAANNQLLQALDTIEEVRNYYEKRVEHIPGESVPLACALFMESIFNCGIGRHNEGIVARIKLQELWSRLQMALPELAERARLALGKQQTYPSMVKLLTRLDLRCGHQQEVTQV